MEEIEYKLNTNNNVLVVNAIEKLIYSIKSKFKPAEKQNFYFENEELKILKEKCSCKEAVVSLTACQGVLCLVEAGILDIAQTMSSMISILPTAQNYAAIISTMGGLLILDLKSRLVPGESYTCQLSLRSPQHPFITVLERKSEVAGDVMSQMQAMCWQNDFRIAENSIEMLRPVFLWLVCNPQEGSTEWRQQCWKLLLGLDENPKQTKMLIECLTWQQYNTAKQCETTFMVFSSLMEIAIHKKQMEYVIALTPVLARISTHYISHGLDPRPCYNIISKSFASEQPELRSVASYTVALLSENLLASPAIYLQELFSLCHTILTKYECTSVSQNEFVALSLQWLQYPSYLTGNQLKIAAKIIDLYENRTSDTPKLSTSNLQSNKVFQILVHTDSKLFLTFRLCKTWERIRDCPEKIKAWLDEIDNTLDGQLKGELLPFLLGIVLEKNCTDFDDVILKAIDIILKVTENNKEWSVPLLSVFWYRLSNASPAVRLQCLKAIPLMGHARENVPTVVSILNKLKAGKGAPTSLLLHLYTNLVDVQTRCYPYLQELLAETSVEKSEIELKWEVDMAKALAVRKICETRASTYGAELVTVLSGILNRCTEPNGAIPSSIALDALRLLWLEHIVSPASTWYALAPKMNKDKRCPVQVSLCKLLGEVPTLRVQTPEYDRFTTDAARRLWSYISDSHYPEVTAAACEALANYRLEDYTLKDIPEVYRRGIKLPASFCKTPADAARKPEDVLDYIPSEVWPNLYKNSSQASLPGISRLCIAYMEREIKAYRSGVYQAESHGKSEPTELRYLPPHSVVRGLMEYVRRQAVSPSYECPDQVLLEMFQCLTSDFSKPLPPMDMCFLHDVFHRGEHFKEQCLLLGTKQALTSGSAKRFVENYLISFDPENSEESDIILIFQLLPHLSRSIPPNVLRISIDKSVSFAYNKLTQITSKHMEECEIKKVLFVQLIDLIRQCLECDKVHDANRTLLSQIIETYMTVLSDDNIAWPTYVEACSALSTKYLERMSSPSSWWEVTGELVRKSGSVRARLAAGAPGAAPSLIWLNETLDAAISTPTEYAFILRSMVPALTRVSVDDTTREWLLQLMARMQTAITESPKDQNALSFLCDVLMLSVVTISGYTKLELDSEQAVLVSRDARCTLFPNAQASLLTKERSQQWQDAAVQIIEWLHHTRSVAGIPECYKRAFHLSLVACRGSAHFSKPNTWTRILGVKPNYAL